MRAGEELEGAGVPVVELLAPPRRPCAGLEDEEHALLATRAGERIAPRALRVVGQATHAVLVIEEHARACVGVAVDGRGRDDGLELQRERLRSHHTMEVRALGQELRIPTAKAACRARCMRRLRLEVVVRRLLIGKAMGSHRARRTLLAKVRRHNVAEAPPNRAPEKTSRENEVALTISLLDPIHRVVALRASVLDENFHRPIAVRALDTARAERDVDVDLFAETKIDRSAELVRRHQRAPTPATRCGSWKHPVEGGVARQGQRPGCAHRVPGDRRHVLRIHQRRQLRGVELDPVGALDTLRLLPLDGRRGGLRVLGRVEAPALHESLTLEHVEHRHVVGLLRVITTDDPEVLLLSPEADECSFRIDSVDGAHPLCATAIRTLRRRLRDGLAPNRRRDVALLHLGRDQLLGSFMRSRR